MKIHYDKGLFIFRGNNLAFQELTKYGEVDYRLMFLSGCEALYLFFGPT